jgi:MSHA biogenesis protein MshP
MKFASAATRRAAHVRANLDAQRQRGFALIPALFLIVVLAALAVVAVRVGTGQQQAVIMSLEEARALAAAQAGIEWGAYQSLNGNCAPTTTLSLSEASLNGFTVVVTCTATTFANGAATANSYVLLATASIGTYGQPGYVRRVLSGTYSSAT